MNQSKGFTFMEVVIATAIFIIFALGAYRAYTTVYSAVAAARHKALAADLVNAQFEIIKNLPYDNVGVVGGDPEGILPLVTTVVRDNVSFVITTTVNHLDDPFDSLAGNGDIFPNDYKLIEISVDCPTCHNFAPVIITGRVAPESIESAFNNFPAFFTHLS